MRVFKVVFVGDSGVGKTSIINSFLGRDVSNVRSTIGVDFYTINMSGKQLVIWDFAGQEWFRDIVVQFLTGAFVVVMVFDLSRPETLINLEKQWMNYVLEFNRPAKVIIVGNKSDIKTIPDDVIINTVDKIKEKLNVEFYIETCALTRENIPKVFDAIFEAIKLAYLVESIKEKESINKYVPMAEMSNM